MTASAHELPHLCVHHEGADPVWRGGPLRNMVGLIQAVTWVDDSGRRFFRLGPRQPLRRLRTAADFALLNRLLDAWRVHS